MQQSDAKSKLMKHKGFNAEIIFSIVTKSVI